MVKGHHHHRHHNHHHDYHRHGHHHDEHLVEKEQLRSSAHEDSTEQESTGTIRVAERILLGSYSFVIIIVIVIII